MAINNKFKCLIFTALFFFWLPVLHAQTTGYFLDTDSVEPRFIQRLAWIGGIYALHCEVIIEKEEGAGYVKYLSEFTTGNYFDISLPPGNYRFRVIPYDILDKPSTGTKWETFKVFNAVKPELYQLEEKIEYINNKQRTKYEFNGKNIEPDSQIYFVNSNKKHIVPVEITRNEDGSGVSLVFDEGQLVDGEYEIFIINPGGLETSLGGIKYKTPKMQTFYIVGVSWMPVHQTNKNLFDNNWILSNISARISINSCMFLNNYFGMELTFSKCMDDNTNKFGGNTAGVNLLLTNWLFNNSAAFNLRAGVVLTAQLMDFSYINTGFSFMYRIVRHLNIEAGINYNYSFRDSISSAILPWVGISLIF